MKTAGIIVEYNPFHNGHQYHIEQTRALTGADFVIAVMSGSFVQRGEPALLDKYTRTQMALLCGADLVLELPVLFATGSAGDFAAGAVSLLDKLGVVDELCFGSECGTIAPFLEAAALLADEPPAFSAALQSALKAGLSFPHARAQALLACSKTSGALSGLLSSPNNILGLEYCLALKKRHSAIRPVTIRREGAGYHEQELSKVQEFSSASAIRTALGKHAGDTALCLKQLAPAVPQTTFSLWHDILMHNHLLLVDDFSRELRYRLLTEADADFTAYADVTRELSDKLKKNRLTNADWSALCEVLKSRELTYSRISRSLCHILLSLTAEDLSRARSHDYVPYARLLGFRSSAAPLLSAIKKSSSVLLLSKLADARTRLAPDALHMLEQDIFASHLWESLSAAKTGRMPRNEYTRQICIL